MTTPDQQNIAYSLLGTSGDFVAWSRLYDDLVTRRRTRIGPPTTSPVVLDSQVLEIADLLRSNPHWTRIEALSSCSIGLKQEHPDEDIENALDITVQAMFMIDSVATRGHASDFRLGGLRPKCWTCSDSLVHFLESSFCKTPESPKTRTVMDNQDSLKSWKLAKKLKITFKGTNNLADHLLYDSRYNTLYLFHHVAWLNAHLGGLANEIPFESDMEAAVTRGTLPPRLLFETLHSLQSILFPSFDPKAHKIMRNLVNRIGFDPECNQYSGYKHKSTPNAEEDVQYQYWGERLVILHDLLAKRPPTTKWEKWLRWQSSEANALGIAILALFISIIVGLISILLSAVQIWITYKAWKEPVK
ncbi:hypothetical protein GQ44DRAFT_772647 [Phaeosphaeriaceae sp. PMI808]|nr:hypothetical protein GQ44DRAFT_772647 [Phaeosphaeriaceae sp. PMI808]